MGRPREHDERTAAALLAAAERAVQEDGVDALSVRGVAADVGTTTRAVYSVFGSKDGLVAALAARAFELLREELEALPVTDDPAADLVAAGLMFRRFATGHPSLFALGFQRRLPSPAVRQTAMEALDVLQQRLQRLGDVGRLGGRTVAGATQQFNALCEGLAVVELRGPHPMGGGEEMWRQAFAALVAGFAAPIS
jgi:AcrR family transcriptional regulator